MVLHIFSRAVLNAIRNKDKQVIQPVRKKSHCEVGKGTWMFQEVRING